MTNTNLKDENGDTQKYIEYLQEENSRLMELVNTLLKQAEEKEKKDAAERRAIQANGIEKAKQAGVKFGRPPKPLPPNFDAVYRLWKNGEISRLEAARRVNMPEGTFRYRSDHYED